MCGICGKLNFELDRKVDAGLLRRMTDAIAHRGPDGQGEYFSGPVGLGHRRLSIIDLNTGDQPMSNEDGTVWVVYNGEIYNFEELRADLVARGHRFKSTTDTEVIVHLYEELGDACVAKFRGMFAFALWDDRNKRLLIARDRVGIKPLYFAHTSRSLVFGSELESILEDPDVVRRVDAEAIDRFLTYYYVPGDRTLFQGIRKLPPAHYLTVERGIVRTHEYWDLPTEPASTARSYDDAKAELEGLLSQTVADHLISDVPVGVLLSGGVDSTGVLSHAVKHSDQPLHTFTMGFEGQGFADERPYARLGADAFGTEHHEISMAASDFRDFLPRYVWRMEEPVCEPPAIALYFVSRLARNTGVKVVLSGEGGDEAFGGYQTYRNLLLLERQEGVWQPRPARSLARNACAERRGGTPVRSLCRHGVATPADYYFSRTASPFTGFNRRKPELYSDSFLRRVDGAPSAEPTRQLFERIPHGSNLQQMLYVDSKSWLPDDLLIKADKMTMATSVELRVPLLDFRVLEFAGSLPDSFKVSGWRLKRILKDVLSGSVPSAILERKKTGFPVPYASWMRLALREYVHDTVLSPTSALRDFFEPTAIARVVQQQADSGRGSKELFSLLVLELWHQQFLRGGEPKRSHDPTVNTADRALAGVAAR